MPRNSENTSRIRQFIDHEATGGLILAGAAVVAISAGQSRARNDSYHHLLEERVRIGIGALTLDKSLHHFINDGLMAVFFFLVGLEIKREVLEGNLSSPSQIVLPAFAAHWAASWCRPGSTPSSTGATPRRSAAGPFRRRPTSPSRLVRWHCWATGRRSHSRFSC
jgi:hypothetical protein